MPAVTPIECTVTIYSFLDLSPTPYWVKEEEMLWIFSDKDTDCSHHLYCIKTHNTNKFTCAVCGRKFARADGTLKETHKISADGLHAFQQQIEKIHSHIKQFPFPEETTGN